jgi:Ser-tRNA(Ala) deacylase AlaX
MKHRFEVQFEGTAIIELDDKVISVVDDEWRSQLYDLHTPVDIAEHIAYNLVINGVGLSNLDGWADQENDNAKIISPPDWEVNGYEIEDDRRLE